MSRAYKKLIPFIVIAVVIVGLDFIARYTTDSFKKRAEEAALIAEEETYIPHESVDYSSVDWLSLYEEEGVEVVSVDADALFTDPKPYEGAYVSTVFTVKDRDTDMLKATTDSNHSIYFSIVCNFDDPAEIEGYSKGDEVTVIGKVTDTNFTVTLSDSHVLDFSSKMD